MKLAVVVIRWKPQFRNLALTSGVYVEMVLLQGLNKWCKSSRRGNTVYLNLTEEDFVPDAVTANDPTADFSTFSLGSKVEQPTLQWTVSLAKDLQRRHKTHILWMGTVPSQSRKHVNCNCKLAWNHRKAGNPTLSARTKLGFYYTTYISEESRLEMHSSQLRASTP